MKDKIPRILALIPCVIVILVITTVTGNFWIEKHKKELELLELFCKEYGGTPKIVHNKSDNSIISFMWSSTFGHMTSYNVVLTSEGHEYFAYIEKTMDWDIRERIPTRGWAIRRARSE